MATQAERYEEIVNSQNSLNNKVIQLKTQLKMYKDQYEEAIAEMKEKFNIDNLDKLRELRKKKYDENEVILKEEENKLAELKSIIETVEQAISEIKKND